MNFLHCDFDLLLFSDPSLFLLVRTKRNGEARVIQLDTELLNAIIGYLRKSIGFFSRCVQYLCNVVQINIAEKEYMVKLKKRKKKKLSSAQIREFTFFLFSLMFIAQVVVIVHPVVVPATCLRRMGNE